jgi:hypothetical protein
MEMAQAQCVAEGHDGVDSVTQEAFECSQADYEAYVTSGWTAISLEKDEFQCFNYPTSPETPEETEDEFGGLWWR